MRRKILDQYGINYLTLTIVDWADVFTRKECRDIGIESLRHCQEPHSYIQKTHIKLKK